MIKDDDEPRLGGSNHRKCQKRKKEERHFGVRKQQAFLRHFAGSCNVVAACKEAGISRWAVYNKRAKDPTFRAAWAAAQEQAYATLEAELVRRSLEFIAAVGPDEASEKTLAGMDTRTILTVLQQQHKKLGVEPGDIRPQRSDLASATERLRKLLKRMKLEVDEAGQAQQAEQAATSEDEGRQ